MIRCSVGLTSSCQELDLYRSTIEICGTMAGCAATAHPRRCAMCLARREQRLLEQIGEQVTRSDPRLASMMAGLRPPSRRRGNPRPRAAARAGQPGEGNAARGSRHGRHAARLGRSAEPARVAGQHRRRPHPGRQRHPGRHRETPAPATAGAIGRTAPAPAKRPAAGPARPVPSLSDRRRTPCAPANGPHHCRPTPARRRGSPLPPDPAVKEDIMHTGPLHQAASIPQTPPGNGAGTQPETAARPQPGTPPRPARPPSRPSSARRR